MRKLTQMLVHSTDILVFIEDFTSSTFFQEIARVLPRDFCVFIDRSLSRE